MSTPQLHSRVLPGGQEQLFYTNVQAMPRFEHKDRWVPRDAATMHRLTTAFFGTDIGRALMVRLAIMRSPQRDIEKDMQDFRDSGMLLAETTAQAQADPDYMVILAEDDFAQMMTAAAISAPRKLITSDELPTPSGTLYFATEQNLDFISKDIEADQLGLKRIRGIQWITMPHETQGAMLLWQFLMDGPVVQEHQKDEPVLFPEELYHYSMPYAFTLSPLEGTPYEKVVPEDQFIMAALLRSLTALIASPHTRQRTVESDKKSAKKKSSRRASKQSTADVRVLSLNNPEYGRYELDSATGRGVRQHWVRGHWRKQWYATEKTNKTIWIDGFIKGNPELGTVTGAKVYRAL